MLGRLLGTKVGMTQIFDENRNVIPVTVVEIGDWFVTQVKTEEKDGYNAVQIGFPRKKYRGFPFSHAWLKNREKFFVHIKEASLSKDDVGFWRWSRWSRIDIPSCSGFDWKHVYRR